MTDKEIISELELKLEKANKKIADLEMLISSMRRAYKYKQIDPYVDDTFKGKPFSPFAQ